MVSQVVAGTVLRSSCSELDLYTESAVQQLHIRNTQCTLSQVATDLLCVLFYLSVCISSHEESNGSSSIAGMNNVVLIAH